MRTHWTDTAAAHLSAIHEYIAKDSAVYAQRMVDRLTRRSEQIAAFPLSGRRVPEYDADDLREIIEPPYRVIYKLRHEQIDILAVIHCAQLLPENV